jgi:hypothetical protein
MESMDIYTEPGKKVMFLGQNGMDWELLKAMNSLVVGETYTVSYIDVGNWSSEVSFQEVEGTYNVVMFANIED